MKANTLLQKKEVSRLTGNERKALRLLLENSRVSDVEIGSKLRVSPQAASKIRRKLEKQGVIKDYFADINLAKLGVNTFAMALLQIDSGDIQNNSELKETLYRNICGLYRVFKNEVSHIAICGFRNLSELDSYFNKLYDEFGDIVKIKNIYVFPTQGITKDSKKELFQTIVKEYGKEKMPIPPEIEYHEPSSKEDNIHKLSGNEKRILKNLLKDSRVSYRKLANNLEEVELTSRGISKIKTRLEEKGIIKGYSTNLDYDKMGLKIFSFIFLKGKTDHAACKDALRNFVEKSYNVVNSYRINEGSLHIMCCVFRSLEELEKYYYLLQSRNKELFEVEKIYLTSPRGILEESPKGLIDSVVS